MSSGSSKSHNVAHLSELFPAIDVSTIELVYTRNNQDFDATLDQLLAHKETPGQVDFATDKNYISTEVQEVSSSPILLQEKKYLDNRDSLGRLVEDEISDIALILTQGGNFSDTVKIDQNSNFDSRHSPKLASPQRLGTNIQQQFQSARNGPSSRQRHFSGSSGEKRQDRSSHLKPTLSNVSEKLRTSATSLNAKTAKSFNTITSSIRRTWSNLRDRLSMDDKFDFDEPAQPSNNNQAYRTNGNSKPREPKYHHQMTHDQYRRDTAAVSPYGEDISISRVAEAMVNPFATVSELDTGDFVLEEDNPPKRSHKKVNLRILPDEGEKSWYSADNPNLTIVDTENSFTLAGPSHR